jgi:hypothetical protein
LSAQIKIWTTQKGGTSIEELLNWALSQGWAAARFFEAFQESLRSNDVIERSGILLSS